MNGLRQEQSEQATLAATIQRGVANYVKDLHTALPGIVDKFDAKTQLAHVRPAVKRVFKTTDGETEILTPTELPLLINVPVVFPSGNGWHLTFPVQQGDECLLIFCERGIANWRNEGGVVKPTAKRFHSLSDAVAVMGLHSSPNAIDNYSTKAIELRTKGNKISIENGLTTLEGETVINGKTTINGETTVNGVSRLNGFTAVTGQATVSAGLAVTGPSINNGKNAGSTHFHNQPPDSDGNSQSSTTPPV